MSSNRITPYRKMLAFHADHEEDESMYGLETMLMVYHL